MGFSQTDVHIYLLEDCPIANYYGPTIRELQHTFPNVSWTFIFPNSYSDSLAFSYVQKHQLKSKAIIRNEHSEIISLDHPFAVSPSVVIIEKKRIVYKGAINDAYASVGKRKMVIQHQYVADILSLLDKNQPVEYFETIPVGCRLSLPKTK